MRAARAAARQRTWQLALVVPDTGPVVIDIDATLVEAHSEKEGAQPTLSAGSFAPILAFLDHGGHRRWSRVEQVQRELG